MVEMTYGDVEKMYGVFVKLANTRDVLSKWEIATRTKILRDILEPINVAREEPREVLEYKKKVEKIYQSNGTPVYDNSGKGYRVKNEDWEKINEARAELEEENADLLKAEESRKEEIAELLKKKVTFDLEPIEYKWCGEITGNELLMLMDFGMVKKPAAKAEKSSTKKKRTRK